MNTLKPTYDERIQALSLSKRLRFVSLVMGDGKKNDWSKMDPHGDNSHREKCLSQIEPRDHATRLDTACTAPQPSPIA